MSEETQLVKPKAFTEITGLTRQTFYNILKAMRSAGIIGESEKLIDLKHPWVVNYISRQGVGQRRHVSPLQADLEQGPAQAPAKETRRAQSSFSVANLPSLADLTHFETFEKVKKLQIDNAVKEGTVISRAVVLAMLDKIEEAFVRIIVDGESAIVEEIVKRSRQAHVENGTIHHDTPPEEIYKFWRNEISKYIKPVKTFMVRELERYDQKKGFDAE